MSSPHSNKNDRKLTLYVMIKKYQYHYSVLRRSVSLEGIESFVLFLCSMFHMLFLDRPLSIGSQNRGMMYILTCDFLTLFALPKLFRLCFLKTKTAGDLCSSTKRIHRLFWSKKIHFPVWNLLDMNRFIIDDV